VLTAGFLAVLLLLNFAFGLSRGDAGPLFFLAVGFVLAGLSHPLGQQVWKEPADPALSKPRAFALALVRGIPADLPLAFYLMWVIPHFNLMPKFAGRLKGFPILPRSATLAEYALCAGLVAIYLFYSQVSSAVFSAVRTERAANATEKGWPRLVRSTRLGALSVLPNLIAMGLVWAAFCSFYGISWDGPACAAVVLSLPLTAALLRWAYRLLFLEAL
jgi:hypothetical protein